MSSGNGIVAGAGRDNAKRDQTSDELNAIAAQAKTEAHAALMHNIDEFAQLCADLVQDYRDADDHVRPCEPAKAQRAKLAQNFCFALRRIYERGTGLIVNDQPLTADERDICAHISALIELHCEATAEAAVEKADGEDLDLPWVE